MLLIQPIFTFYINFFSILLTFF